LSNWTDQTVMCGIFDQLGLELDANPLLFFF
jgi:hypothetical protein